MDWSWLSTELATAVTRPHSPIDSHVWGYMEISAWMQQITEEMMFIIKFLMLQDT